MEGPTPVSALIHAATMVTAGVYLIARMHPLFEQAPAAADVGAIIGCVTLLVAGTIGLVVTDLKRVIAYSTMSQIGYMIMAVSAGAYAAGLFHLMTHAFFKALLFMAAGSVIARDGRRAVARPDGRLPPRDAVHLRLLRRSAASRCRASRRSRASSPRTRSSPSIGDARRLVLDAALRRRLHRRVPDRGLHVADDLPRLLGRARCPRRVELERGHLHHAEHHVNPATGELEDTEVGFPGPEHHIAERALPMKLAMGMLAVLAVLGGFVQVPSVDRRPSTTSSSRRSPARTLEAAPDRRRSPSSASCVGTVLGLARHRHRLLRLGAAARARRPRVAGALRRPAPAVLATSGTSTS